MQLDLILAPLFIFVSASAETGLLTSNFTENILTIIGMLSVATIVILSFIVSAKNEKMKKMQAVMADMQKTCNDLDNQAKLIVKTDLELHKTQSELDKKVSGLYTLQKISHTLSTTLDENEIFEKISEAYCTELGFDKALVLFVDPRQPTIDENSVVKRAIGYSPEDIVSLRMSTLTREVLGPTLKEGKVTSNFDSKVNTKDLQHFLQKISLVTSFICAPIAMKKEGIVGLLFVGSVTTYSPLTSGDKEIISILATQIGQSLENAQLFEETWRAYQDLEKKVHQRTKELSHALEEIKVITKRKSDFVSAVAHELRTPLTSIKGYAALLSAGKLGVVPDQVKERLEKINKNADSLSQLINDLLDISRIESGRVEMRLEPIPLKSMTDAIADMFGPQLKEKQITFSVTIPDAMTVTADKGQLQRVFMNLVSNAYKFTPANGTISITAHESGDHFQIDVADTGTGISEENVAKVFEEFFREDNEINKNVKGTGLGLSLVKYIIEAHKGKIWAHSKLHQGTAFSFSLPKTDSTPNASA